MARLARKRPSALRDIAETGAYIGRDSLDAEIRFYDAAEQTFAQLLEMPGLGRVWTAQVVLRTEVRVQPVRGFPNWLVFYRRTEQGIEVIRVLHGARDVGAILADEIVDGPSEEPTQG